MKKVGKRGQSLVASEVIFVVLNLTVLIVLFLAVSYTSTPDPLYEEAYAKEIALLLDGSKPGTILTLDMTEMYQIALNNNAPMIVEIDCERNSVLVKATNGNGYKFDFFTDLDKCDYKLDNQKRSLTIRV